VHGAFERNLGDFEVRAIAAIDFRLKDAVQLPADAFGEATEQMNRPAQRARIERLMGSKAGRGVRACHCHHVSYGLLRRKDPEKFQGRLRVSGRVRKSLDMREMALSIGTILAAS
jgi:hypothetical protein